MKKGPKFRGYAAVYDQTTTIYGEVPESDELTLFRERVRPGAFRDSLAEGADIEAFFNHKPDYIIARRSNGTLKLEEDAHGLAVTIDAAPIPLASDLETLIGRRDICGMSFEFTVRDGGASWRRGKDGLWERDLRSLNLHEVSVVTRPAYPGTTVAVAFSAAAHDARTATIDGMLAADERRRRIDAAMGR